MSFSPALKCWLAFEADNRYRGLQGVTGDPGSQGLTGSTGAHGPCNAAGTDFGFESIGSRTTEIPWESGTFGDGLMIYNWQDQTSFHTDLQSGSINFTASASLGAVFFQQYIHVCPGVNYDFSVVSSLYLNILFYPKR